MAEFETMSFQYPIEGMEDWLAGLWFKNQNMYRYVTERLGVSKFNFMNNDMAAHALARFQSYAITGRPEWESGNAEYDDMVKKTKERKSYIKGQVTDLLGGQYNSSGYNKLPGAAALLATDTGVRFAGTHDLLAKADDGWKAYSIRLKGIDVTKAEWAEIEALAKINQEKDILKGISLNALGGGINGLQAAWKANDLVNPFQSVLERRDDKGQKAFEQIAFDNNFGVYGIQEQLYIASEGYKRVQENEKNVYSENSMPRAQGILSQVTIPRRRLDNGRYEYLWNPHAMLYEESPIQPMSLGNVGLLQHLFKASIPSLIQSNEGIQSFHDNSNLGAAAFDRAFQNAVSQGRHPSIRFSLPNAVPDTPEYDFNLDRFGTRGAVTNGLVDSAEGLKTIISGNTNKHQQIWQNRVQQSLKDEQFRDRTGMDKQGQLATLSDLERQRAKITSGEAEGMGVTELSAPSINEVPSGAAEAQLEALKKEAQRAEDITSQYGKETAVNRGLPAGESARRTIPLSGMDAMTQQYMGAVPDHLVGLAREIYKPLFKDAEGKVSRETEPIASVGRKWVQRLYNADRQGDLETKNISISALEAVKNAWNEKTYDKNTATQIDHAYQASLSDLRYDRQQALEQERDEREKERDAKRAADRKLSYESQVRRLQTQMEAGKFSGTESVADLYGRLADLPAEYSDKNYAELKKIKDEYYTTTQYGNQRKRELTYQSRARRFGTELIHGRYKNAPGVHDIFEQVKALGDEYTPENEETLEILRDDYREARATYQEEEREAAPLRREAQAKHKRLQRGRHRLIQNLEAKYAPEMWAAWDRYQESDQTADDYAGFADSMALFKSWEQSGKPIDNLNRLVDKARDQWVRTGGDPEKFEKKVASRIEKSPFDENGNMRSLEANRLLEAQGIALLDAAMQKHLQQVKSLENMYKSISQVPVYDYYKNWTAYKGQQNEVLQAINGSGFVPGGVQKMSSRLLQSWQQEVEGTLSVPRGIWNIANALAPVAGGVFGALVGGAPGATLGAGAAGGIVGAASQIHGNMQMAGIVGMGQTIASRINFWSFLLEPLRWGGELLKSALGGLGKVISSFRLPNIFPWLRGIGLGLGALFGLGMDNMAKYHFPMSTVSGERDYNKMYQSTVMDRASGLSQGSTNNAIENMARAGVGLYTMGQYNQNQIVAAAMLGRFNQIYRPNPMSSDTGSSTYDEYERMVSEEAQKIYFNPSIGAKQMYLWEQVDPTIAKNIQALVKASEYRGRPVSWNELAGVGAEGAAYYGVPVQLTEMSTKRREEYNIASTAFSMMGDMIKNNVVSIAYDWFTSGSKPEGSGFAKTAYQWFVDLTEIFAHGDNKIRRTIAHFGEGLRILWDALDSGMEQLFGAPYVWLKDKVKGVIDDIGNQDWAGLANKIKTGMKWVWDNALTPAIDVVKGLAVSIMPAVKIGVQGATGFIVDAFFDVGLKIYEAIKVVGDAIYKNFRDVVIDISSLHINGPESLKALLAGESDWLKIVPTLDDKVAMEKKTPSVWNKPNGMNLLDWGAYTASNLGKFDIGVNEVGKYNTLAELYRARAGYAVSNGYKDWESFNAGLKDLPHGMKALTAGARYGLWFEQMSGKRLPDEFFDAMLTDKYSPWQAARWIEKYLGKDPGMSLPVLTSFESILRGQYFSIQDNDQSTWATDPSKHVADALQKQLLGILEKGGKLDPGQHTQALISTATYEYERKKSEPSWSGLPSWWYDIAAKYKGIVPLNTMPDVYKTVTGGSSVQGTSTPLAKFLEEAKDNNPINYLWNKLTGENELIPETLKKAIEGLRAAAKATVGELNEELFRLLEGLLTQPTGTAQTSETAANQNAPPKVELEITTNDDTVAKVVEATNNVAVKLKRWVSVKTNQGADWIEDYGRGLADLASAFKEGYDKRGTPQVTK